MLNVTPDFIRGKDIYPGYLVMYRISPSLNYDLIRGEAI